MVNPSIRYVIDGESIEDQTMARQVDDIVENLERITNKISNGTENLDAGDFTTGVISPVRLPVANETTKGSVRKARTSDIENVIETTRYITPKQVADRVNELGGSTGVALSGNPVIVAGLSETYTITNFDSFSSYSVSIDVGDATLDHDGIEVEIPGAAEGTATLIVNKNGRSFEFVISINDSGVLTPTILQPTQGSTTFSIVGNIQGSAFQTVPPGVDTHESTDWQVATDAGFSNIVAESLADTSNLLSWNPSPQLDPGVTYYARIRYYGTTIQESGWSATRSFTTANSAETPSITSPTANQIGITETPTLTSSAFNSPIAESHQSSDWEVRLASNDSLVWSTSNNTSALTSVSIPGGVLQENTEYRVRVRYRGSVLGLTDWSPFINFTTQVIFFDFSPSSAGLPLEGGYYTGGNIIIDGQKYALIVAPSFTIGTERRAFGGSGSPSLSLTDNDGMHNTQQMVNSGSSFPAASFCNNLTTNGYNDWYLPSFAELEICYRFLKPTNTTNSTATTSFGRYENPHSEPLGFNYTSTNPRYSTNPYASTFNPHAFRTGTSSSSTSTSAGAWELMWTGSGSSCTFPNRISERDYNVTQTNTSVSYYYHHSGDYNYRYVMRFNNGARRNSLSPFASDNVSQSSGPTLTGPMRLEYETCTTYNIFMPDQVIITGYHVYYNRVRNYLVTHDSEIFLTRAVRKIHIGPA